MWKTRTCHPTSSESSARPTKCGAPTSSSSSPTTTCSTTTWCSAKRRGSSTRATATATPRRPTSNGCNGLTVRALVTGGAGFIGSNLVDRLIDDGHDVVVVDDLFTGFRANVNAKATFVEGTVADEALVRDAMVGVDVVFHQAAHKAVMRSVEQPLVTDT